ncbi:MAG: formylglycine-generating enzyme family protein [bacterium]
MRRIKIWRWVPTAVLLWVGLTTGSWASTNLANTSFAAGGNLVFRTPENCTSQHLYRVECTTSLVSAVWACVRTVIGVGPDNSVSNGLTSAADAAFYRVVATSNSATFVDGSYMVIDVSGGTSVTSYPVAYYGTKTAVPGGITNDVYKTTQVLMRYIPNGVFIMGSPTDEPGRHINEAQHQVTLTNDFYMGVFEVTQKQWERVMGNWPSYFDNVTYRDSRPVEMVSYYQIRENPDNNDDPAVDWPANSVVNANSFMGKLRAKTGLSALDLPTESQWEYACRAGTTTALNSGKNHQTEANMSEVGRYLYNGGSEFWQDSSPNAGTATAGTYLPNAWGLYDMHGNVREWCLDWFPGYEGSGRVFRGGDWSVGAEPCRAAYRSNPYEPDSRIDKIGFRLSRTLP